MSTIPEHVQRLAGVMAGYEHPWALCGGWAVDAWLGRESRKHGDIDIAVFTDDLPAVFAHFSGWEVVAHDPTVYGGTEERWNGRPLELPAHLHIPAVYACEKGAIYSEDGFNIDVQVNERRDGRWVLNGAPVIDLALGDVIRPSAWGVPAVIPEVLLFYKTGEERRRHRDERDFEALLPVLAPQQRTWLRDALAAVRPEHDWIRELAGS
jgi:hypothetical protein